MKEELLNKINSSSEEQTNLFDESFVQDEESSENLSLENSSAEVENLAPTKKRFKFSVISAQLLVIGLLIATILITNSVYPNSGLNVFMRGIFNGQEAEEVADLREYSEFAPVISSEGNVSMQDGVVTISGEGRVYSTANGKITQIIQQPDGTFSMEIMHSEKFLSHITGLDRVYSQVGDSVFCTIPVGYVDDVVSMCFKNSDGQIISDFELVDNSVVWAE